MDWAFLPGGWLEITLTILVLYITIPVLNIYAGLFKPLFVVSIKSCEIVMGFLILPFELKNIKIFRYPKLAIFKHIF